MRRRTTSDVIKEAIEVHGDKYNYSQTIYKTVREKIKIVCYEHGEFEQLPYNHIKLKHGCPNCSLDNHKMTTNKFLKKLSSLDNKYDYSLVEYTNHYTKIKIICPIHDVFEQLPYQHLNGHGCSKCNTSKGEYLIEKFLQDNNINYITQKTFKHCVDKSRLKFDFYLNEHNICIEYDGIQHFKSIEYFGGDAYLLDVKHKDDIKTEYCFNNNIRLIRIPYTEFNNIESILEELGKKINI